MVVHEPHRRLLFNAGARFSVSDATATSPGTLTGYALLWNTLSDDRGGFKVRLLPDSAKFAAPTLALFNHDSNLVIGNTANQTLRLNVDATGVNFEINLPDTTAGRDTATLVRAGYVNGMSFAMTGLPKSKTVTENGQKILEVSDYTVDEITVTPVPAFISTTVDVKDDQPMEQKHSARNAHSLKLNRFKLDNLRLPGAKFPRVSVDSTTRIPALN